MSVAHRRAAGVARGIVPGLLAASLAFGQAFAADAPPQADFDGEPASAEARHVANWAVHAGDHHAGDGHRLPFAIIDKRDARVFVFGADGRLRGAAPALLGLARSDDPVPGIGERPLSRIRDHEKTTPAGRFVSSIGRSLRGEDVLWVDYETATSLHRVITSNPKERRAQRLASATTKDNRISYGCINVPVKFYENVVRPAFADTYVIVYVLPETRTARETFASYDIGEGAQEQQKLAVQRGQKKAVK